MNSDFWDLFYSLSETHPDWSAEVVAHYLDRCLKLARETTDPNPFRLGDSNLLASRADPQLFARCASGDPAAFVRNVLPSMLAIMDANAERRGDPGWSDQIWSVRFVGEGVQADDAILYAMESALRAVAVDDPQHFERVASLLREQPFETAQFLLIRAYSANAPRFADQAAAYLTERPQRLSSGYADNPYWAARELIEAITPHCSRTSLQMLESVLLDYLPELKGVYHTRWYGRAQWTLLAGIAAGRRSCTVMRRLGEWKRKFGTAAQPPRSIEMRSVPSPIPESAARRMTDAQWLRAITKYGDERMVWVEGSPLGGAREVASRLQVQVRDEPLRFSHLVQKFPLDSHTAYFDAVLYGLDEAVLTDAALLGVWRHCHQLPGRPCARALCRSIGRHAERRDVDVSGMLPHEVAEIVSWYATEAPDPIEELWRADTGSGQPYYGGDILAAGLNSDRGAAALALYPLLFDDPSLIYSLRSVIEKILNDPMLAVRAVAAMPLQAVLRHDRDLAVRLFIELCHTEDGLLKTQYVERFLGFALHSHFSVLAHTIERMLASGDPKVRATGSRCACVASLFVDDARSIASRCVVGDISTRKAAAEVFAANLHIARFRSQCEDGLLKLFYDPDAEIRVAAADGFRNFQGEELADYDSLLAAFVDSPASLHSERTVLYALNRTTARLSDIALRVCERFLESAGRDVGDIRTRSAADAHLVSKIVVRAYNQSVDAGTKSRCLDIIDRMIDVSAYGMLDAMTLFER